MFVGILLGRMTLRAKREVQAIVASLHPACVHLLEGCPCSFSVSQLRYAIQRKTVLRGLEPTTTTCTVLPLEESVRTLQTSEGPRVYTECADWATAYLRIIQRCDVLVGSPAGIQRAQAINPLALYIEVQR
jgi:hypothetical protein